MKKKSILVLGIAVAMLGFSAVVSAQDQNKIHIKITKDVDGESQTFEGEYDSQEQMESDPLLKEFQGDSETFAFGFSGNGNAMVDMRKMMSEMGDSNSFFSYHFQGSDELREMEQRMKEQIEQLRQQHSQWDQDEWEKDEWIDETSEGDGQMSIEEVSDDEFGKVGNVKSQELLDLDDLEVRMNATSGLIRLKFSVPEEKALTITIFNKQGNQVYSNHYERYGGDFFDTIDMSKRQAGSYLLEVKMDKKRLVRKINLN
ncbi:MAG: T9SS type A sorting domain-containing protein [Cyclobacteriaceae bacterium]